MKAITQLNKLKIKEDRLILSYEKKYASLVYKAINKQIEQYNDTRLISDEIMYDVLKELYKHVFVSSAKNQYRQLEAFETKSISLFLGLWDSWIEVWSATNLSIKIQEINDTTRKLISKIVANGVNEGLREDDIARQITNRFKGDIGKARAKMIARTETGNAVNLGKQKSASDWSDESGVDTMKMWIHRPVKEPRGWHYKLDDNKAYPMDFKWSVTNPHTNITDMMDRPHDQNASAGNVINCVCIVNIVSKRFGERLNRNQ